MKLVTSDDTQLMGDVTAGSAQAFSELYDRFRNRAHQVALSVCRDEGHAQDAVQEAFLSLWTSRANYEPHRGTVTTWVLTVVRYRAIDLARRNRHHAAHWSSEDQLNTSPGVDDVTAPVIQRDDADRLQASLALLPVRQQEVLTLAYFGGLSNTEIASRLGLPAGTVKGRMRLGLQKLRTNIDQEAA